MGSLAFTAPRQLEPNDPLDGFSCGISLIDTWLHARARNARAAGTAVVYVSYAASGRLAGFYTLSAHSLERSATRGWMARNAPEQIPGILLGMLGVDASFQGMHLGSNLLLDAVHRAMTVADTIGARALLVDPIDDASRAFYAHHGFKPLPESTRMYAKLM